MRLTEYHCGVAVIKDKSKHKQAMEKLARYEDAEESISRRVDVVEYINTQLKKQMADDLKANPMYQLVRDHAIDDFISRIVFELDNTNSSTEYSCQDGTKIYTDVGYVREWFAEYKEKLKEI